MKNILSIVVLLVVLTGVGYFISRGDSKKTTTAKDNPTITQQIKGTSNQNGIVLFTGKGCPHCANVEKYIKDNNIAEKVKFETKEVWYNEVNNKQMLDVATKCGLAKDQIGVPFMWTGAKCLVGEDEVMNFFKEQTNVK